MITFLAKHFIKDYENTSSPAVRQGYGMLCGIMGIGLNILLFLGKFLAGSLSHSIAITADAFNNLSDAGSSAITLLGFKMAGKEPDLDHPFGHGRIEYLSGLLVSCAIILMAYELVRSSIDKILHPSETQSSALILCILIASIAVKIYMSIYNRGIGKKISSAAMHATATDSISDSLATTVVLLCTLISKLTGLQIDGYCGVLVGLFIFYAGFSAAKDTLSPLLGQAPDPEFVKEVQDIVLADEHVLGIHDLVVHDYGPGRVMISLHAEVPADQNILILHDAIDNLEVKIKRQLHSDATIHMDPVETDNAEVNSLRTQLAEIIKNHPEVTSFHDFRMVSGKTHTNLIFDILLPMNYKGDEAALLTAIRHDIQERFGNQYFAVIQVDRDYTAG